MLSSLEIGFKRRDKQTLTESARTAEEVNLSCRYQTVDKFGLIYINIIIFDDAFKILYADRVFHNRLASSVDKYMQTYTFSLG